MSFAIAPEVVLASAVANAATVTIPAYPAGTTQASFIGVNAAPNTGVAILNGNEVYREAAAGVRVNITYNGSDITVTNNTGVTWPAGSRLLMQFGRAGVDRPGFQTPPAIASLTDSSGGTAGTTIAAIGATYTQAEVRNAVASLNAQIERILIAMRTANLIQ